jgi:hypothetical protein
VDASPALAVVLDVRIGKGGEGGGDDPSWLSVALMSSKEEVTMMMRQVFLALFAIGRERPTEDDDRSTIRPSASLQRTWYVLKMDIKNDLSWKALCLGFC